MSRASVLRPMREPRWSEGEARRALAAWARSGLSSARWCAERGVSLQRLRYWRLKLGEPELAAPEAPTVPRLVAVRMKTEPSPTPEFRPPWALEIGVGPRVYVRLSSQAPVELVRQVLELTLGPGGC